MNNLLFFRFSDKEGFFKSMFIIMSFVFHLFVLCASTTTVTDEAIHKYKYFMMIIKIID